MKAETPDPRVEWVWRLACTDESSKLVEGYLFEPNFGELNDPKEVVVGDDEVNVDVTEAGGNTCRLVIGESKSYDVKSWAELSTVE